MSASKAFDCTLCNGSELSSQPTYRRGRLAPGDIIAAPIYIQLLLLNHILQDADGCWDAPRSVLTHARSAFTSHIGWNNEATAVINHLPDELKKKSPPCLVVKVPMKYESAECVTMCTITSLDGVRSVDNGSVNEIIRRFAIPLHPFLQKHPNHIHAVPVWKGVLHSGNDPTSETTNPPPAWILARPVQISEVAFTKCFGSSIRWWTGAEEDGQQFTYHLEPSERRALPVWC